MILLDTNVVSELMKAAPEPRVRDWLDKQISSDVWTSAVTVYELRWGIERLRQGRRRTVLEAGLDIVLRTDLGDRVVNLDRSAAYQAAALEVRRAVSGLVVELSDTLIAGIALAREATIATRNTRHFEDLSTPVVDPWTA